MNGMCGKGKRESKAEKSDIGRNSKQILTLAFLQFSQLRYSFLFRVNWISRSEAILEDKMTR